VSPDHPSQLTTLRAGAAAVAAAGSEGAPAVPEEPALPAAAAGRAAHVPGPRRPLRGAPARAEAVDQRQRRRRRVLVVAGKDSKAPPERSNSFYAQAVSPIASSSSSGTPCPSRITAASAPGGRHSRLRLEQDRRRKKTRCEPDAHTYTGMSALGARDADDS
jgi:hypothetical protein